MKKFLILLALICATSAWSATCPYPVAQENLCASVAWNNGPVYDAYSKVTVTFYKEAEGKKVPAEPSKPVVFYPWMIMPNMEHGARPVEVQSLGTGTYEISKIYFSMMPGHWEMRVRYEDEADKKKALLKVPVVFP